MCSPPPLLSSPSFLRLSFSHASFSLFSSSLRLLRSLPRHDRLVDLHGSVIDHTYSGGSSIAVLLIMERLHKDLYTGLKVRHGNHTTHKDLYTTLKP